MPDLPRAPELPDIRLAGFLNSGLGLGETARRMVRCLESAGVPVQTHAWEKTDVATVPFATSGPPAALANGNPGISILCINGDQIPSFLNHAGPAFTAGTYVICVWFWELPELPAGMDEAFRQVDEVWAATPFIKEALAKSSGEVPVHSFIHPAIAPAGSTAEARARFPFDGRFVFLLAFDYQSCAKRKNPGGVCEAFAMAFPVPAPGGPLCLIKSMNAGLHPVDHVLLKRRWAHRPDIVFMDDFLSPADRDLLCWRADACVSLHRSEGLSLTLLEGMTLGKPCIATAWSGNMAFMSDRTAWLIPSQPVPVGRGSLHYDATQIWAEPDVPSAAAAMREVAAGGPDVAARAAAGQDYLRTHHDPLMAGASMRRLLEKAAGNTPRKKPLLPGRRSVADALKSLREFEQKLRTAPKASGWQLPSSVSGTRQDLIHLTQLQRHALTQSLAALKHLDQQTKARHQYLLRENQRLADQLAGLAASLPPVPGP